MSHSLGEIPAEGAETSGEDGQATTGDGWMPWGQKPKKGAAHGDTLRGAASTQGSGDTRMGQPRLRDGRRLQLSQAGEATGGTETS